MDGGPHVVPAPLTGSSSLREHFPRDCLKSLCSGKKLMCPHILCSQRKETASRERDNRLSLGLHDTWTSLPLGGGGGKEAAPGSIVL